MRGNISAAQLHLRNARQDGKDAVFSGSASINCTHLVFPVTPDDAIRSGSFAARVSAPGGATLQLPSKITVVRPLTISAVNQSIQLPADGTAVQLRVQLSGPANGTVRVRLQLSDGAVQVRMHVCRGVGGR